MGLFKKTPTQQPRWPLNTALMSWGRRDAWTLREALEGCLILGATGSGKTSGSGSAIAKAFVAAGFGGVVLTAKPDERQRWQHVCERAGRADDLLVIGPDNELAFNFLDDEVKRTDAGAGLTENVVNLFSTVLEIAERGTSAGGGGREDEGYWKRALRQLCRNLVDLSVLATGGVSVPQLYAMLVSAPNSPEEVNSTHWQQRSLLFRALLDADRRMKTPRQQRDLALVDEYFRGEFPALSDRTRSVIVSSFTSMIDILNRGLLRDVFCDKTNITPEAVEAGRIIVVDFPVKQFGEVGQIAQVIFKYAFQKSIERREVSDETRPAFIWMDECQHFITSQDAMFQATCRSARVATVMLTQSIAGLYAALGGGDKGRVEADALVGNLNTKLFHANLDPTSNEWAASLIGRSRQFMISANASQSADWFSRTFGLGEPGQSNAGLSEVFEHEVQPAAFTKLRNGGERYKGNVDAIVVQAGRRFASTGGIWRPVTFKQG